MQWYVSKAIDSLREIEARIEFITELTGRSYTKMETVRFYVLNDGVKKNNRIFIIGHTNDAAEVINTIIEKNGKYKYIFYVCACIMNNNYVEYLKRLAVHCDLYFAKQETFVLANCGSQFDGCRFWDKTTTGFEFKITSTELDLYNAKGKFRDSLNQCFEKMKG